MRLVDSANYASTDGAWGEGERFVAELLLAPDEPKPCPCCGKPVVLCVAHLELHAPGVPCIECKKEAEE